MIKMRFKRIEQIPCNEMLSILECLLLNAPHCLGTHCVSLTQMEHSSSMEKKVPCLFSSKTLSFYVLVFNPNAVNISGVVGGGAVLLYLTGMCEYEIKGNGSFSRLEREVTCLSHTYHKQVTSISPACFCDPTVGNFDVSPKAPPPPTPLKQFLKF